jgi:SdpC family antimicrobial peptide
MIRESNAKSGLRFGLLACGAALVTMLGASAVGCAVDAGGAGGPTAQSDVKSSAIDGEAAVRGVFFGQGEVASRLPDLWQITDVKGEGLERVDTAIARVRAASPESIERFGTEVGSGDVVRVRAALLDMSTRLQDASAVDAHPVHDQSRIAVIVYLYKGLVIDQVMNIYPVIVLASPTDKLKQGLTQDDLVQHVTERLATDPS